jgi:hypothetical protein
MKLWLISQSVNRDYDTYDSSVVAAKTEADARETHPADYLKMLWRPNDQGNFGWVHIREDGSKYWPSSDFSDWAVPANVTAKLIGNAVKGTEAGPICSSFNAG